MSATFLPMRSPSRGRPSTRGTWRWRPPWRRRRSRHAGPPGISPPVWRWPSFAFRSSPPPP
eukprot:2026660-Lingulodinium_polyedra.AAC.1